jgi:hypothetical protein
MIFDVFRRGKEISVAAMKAGRPRWPAKLKLERRPSPLAERKAAVIAQSKSKPRRPGNGSACASGGTFLARTQNGSNRKAHRGQERAVSADLMQPFHSGRTKSGTACSNVHTRHNVNNMRWPCAYMINSALHCMTVHRCAAPARLAALALPPATQPPRRAPR